MKITKGDLETAAQRSEIELKTVDRLWSALSAIDSEKAEGRLSLEHILYFLGGLIVIGSMGWWMGQSWDQLEGYTISLIGLAYGLLFWFGGRHLAVRKSKEMAGGILATCSICMVPLIVYGFQKQFGFWPADNPGSYGNFHPRINGSWIVMELATILTAIAALRRTRFPFLVAPAAFAAWYLSMDFADLVVGERYRERELITMWCGLFFVAATYLADLRRYDRDFTFWGYLFGALSFWCGLSLQDSNSELAKFIYCLINIGMIVFSLVVRRVIFVVLGALGLNYYMAHLAKHVFEESVAYPIILSSIGLTVLFMGLIAGRLRPRLVELSNRMVCSKMGFLFPARLKDEVNAMGRTCRDSQYPLVSSE